MKNDHRDTSSADDHEKVARSMPAGSPKPVHELDGETALLPEYISGPRSEGDGPLPERLTDSEVEQLRRVKKEQGDRSTMGARNSEPPAEAMSEKMPLGVGGVPPQMKPPVVRLPDGTVRYESGIE